MAQLSGKLQLMNRGSGLLIDYLLLKTVKVQAFYRMALARRRYLLLAKAERLFLATGPARLTHSAKQPGAQLENTRQVTWLELRPPTLKFVVFSFEKRDKRTWSTFVSLSELRTLNTACRRVLAARARLESKAYLASLGSLR